MGIVWLFIIGAAAGFLATRVMKVEADVVTTIAIGVVGALIGGLILRFILTIGGMIGGLVGAVAGAVVLIWLWQTFIAK